MCARLASHSRAANLIEPMREELRVWVSQNCKALVSGITVPSADLNSA